MRFALLTALLGLMTACGLPQNNEAEGVAPQVEISLTEGMSGQDFLNKYQTQLKDLLKSGSNPYVYWAFSLRRSGENLIYGSNIDDQTFLNRTFTNLAFLGTAYTTYQTDSGPQTVGRKVLALLADAQGFYTGIVFFNENSNLYPLYKTDYIRFLNYGKTAQMMLAFGTTKYDLFELAEFQIQNAIPLSAYVTTATGNITGESTLANFLRAAHTKKQIPATSDGTIANKKMALPIILDKNNFKLGETINRPTKAPALPTIFENDFFSNNNYTQLFLPDIKYRTQTTTKRIKSKAVLKYLSGGHALLEIAVPLHPDNLPQFTLANLLDSHVQRIGLSTTDPTHIVASP